MIGATRQRPIRKVFNMLRAVMMVNVTGVGNALDRVRFDTIVEPISQQFIDNIFFYFQKFHQIGKSSKNNKANLHKN